MRVQDLSDYEYAHKRLSYDPETGIFRWKFAGPEFFKDSVAHRRWNTRFAGATAGTRKPDSYVKVNIRGKIVSAHRLAWLMHYGDWPEMNIDHINWDKGDNSIANLRNVTASENGRNRGKQSNNTSGVLGVTWHKGNRRWSSQIQTDNGLVYLGSFTDLREAEKVRREAEAKYGYHPNHGRD